MSDKLAAITLREQLLDEEGHDENCAKREGHACSCGVEQPVDAQAQYEKLKLERGKRPYVQPISPDDETLTGDAAAKLRAYKAAAAAVRAAEESHRRAAETYRKALEEFTEAVMR